MQGNHRSTHPNPSQLWINICRRLGIDPLARGALDKVHQLLAGTIGRGSLQRVREGEGGINLSTLLKLATELECLPADLLESISSSSDVKPPSVRKGLLRHGLHDVRKALLLLSGDDSMRAAEALRQLALYPDSDRAMAKALEALSPVSSVDRADRDPNLAEQ